LLEQIPGIAVTVRGRALIELLRPWYQVGGPDTER
jgi:hypothetical protein